MATSRRPSSPLAVGVDVGGTWVRVQAMAGDRVVARTSTRAPALVDLGGRLRALWRRAGWQGGRVASLVVASKGVWTPAECQRLARTLAGLARRLRVVPDAQAAALGALDGGAGVLVLSGTGSIVVGHDGHGHWTRAGGFGPLLGDEGSGFWLGREWVRATIGPGDFDTARPLSHAASPVAAIAALAPTVIRRARAGDRRALRVVRAGQAHLAACAAHVARELRLARPVLVSWAGSVLADPWFRAGVARALARAGIPARWRSPAVEPVVAAARLARALAPRPRRRRPGRPAAAPRRSPA